MAASHPHPPYNEIVACHDGVVWPYTAWAARMTQERATVRTAARMKGIVEGKERKMPRGNDAYTASPPAPNTAVSNAIDRRTPLGEATEGDTAWEAQAHAGEHPCDCPAASAQWRPNHGEQYWEIDADGEIRCYQWVETQQNPGTQWIAKTWAFGNCFNPVRRLNTPATASRRICARFMHNTPESHRQHYHTAGTGESRRIFCSDPVTAH